MKDLLGKEIRKNDLVVYVFIDKRGSLQTLKGKVVGFDKRGAKIITNIGDRTVKNVIKLQQNIVEKLFNLNKLQVKK